MFQHQKMSNYNMNMKFKYQIQQQRNYKIEYKRRCRAVLDNERLTISKNDKIRILTQQSVPQ